MRHRLLRTGPRLFSGAISALHRPAELGTPYNPASQQAACSL
ncbi:PREDICTED: uncharacterized protein MIR205HG [Galeopterus variegatus]|uniref:Uncharacterized protein MIR205HG n=1 Tax=Galeopterus variegatus TaxID=482537 RepID=A0ABM0RVD6_GALVR|nr:PREDICTED: uncharacterized protein MIR205HG [Galeopterus variegatus]